MSLVVRARTIEHAFYKRTLFRSSLIWATLFHRRQRNCLLHLPNQFVLFRRSSSNREVGTKTSIDEVRDEEQSISSEDTGISPWYLQVANPQRSTNPLLQRQRLPVLPQNSPHLLRPLVEYVSIEAGLDDLMLFDLRDINPPPALGANLLILIGTARSEKHLHISADRLCKWLRNTHHLKPHADGLLGRGELKLKIRRKVRRAKLLRKAGAAEKVSPDDGISTGWICTNVDLIGEQSYSESNMQHTDVGQVGGECKVAIQMLTQEKRDELDLEDLWRGMLEEQQETQKELSYFVEQPTLATGQRP